MSPRWIALAVVLGLALPSRADEAGDSGSPIVPGVNLYAVPGTMPGMQAPTTGAFARGNRLILGLSWFGWSAASGLAATAIAVGSKPPSEERAQTLALSIPLGTFYAPIVFGSLWDGACGDGTDAPAARWRDAGGFGSVVYGVSWVVRALVVGAFLSQDSVWPAYAGAVAGSAIEAVGVAMLAGE